MVAKTKRVEKERSAEVKGAGSVGGRPVGASTEADGKKTVNGKVNGKGKLVGNGAILNGTNGRSKGMELLAKTMYKELKNSGYDFGQILDFSGKLIDFVHDDISSETESGDIKK